MNSSSNLNLQILGAWAGPLFVMIFLITFGVMGLNLPQPISPASTAEVMASYYQNNLSDLRLGWLVSLIFVSLYLPWSAQISEHIRQIEKDSRLLTYTQLICGALTVYVVSWAMLCWAVASFRPDRSSEITQMLHDFGWLSLELQWCITTVQMFAMGIAGLYDRRADVLWPRWACFLSMFCGLTFAPASLTLYLKTGPFAWNGFFSFYFPYFAWLLWVVMISYFMIAHLKKQRKKL